MESFVKEKKPVPVKTLYKSLVKDYDNAQRYELGLLLIKSVKIAGDESVNNATKKKLDACDFAGIWSDDEYMDADELVKTIHNARRFKNRYEFWDNLIEEDINEANKKVSA